MLLIQKGINRIKVISSINKINFTTTKVTNSINKRNFSTTRRLNMDMDSAVQASINAAQFPDALILLEMHIRKCIYYFENAERIADCIVRNSHWNYPFIPGDLNKLLLTHLE